MNLFPAYLQGFLSVFFLITHMSDKIIHLFVLEQDYRGYSAEHDFQYTWLFCHNKTKGFYFAKSNHKSNVKYFATLDQLKSFREWCFDHGFELRTQYNTID